MIKKKKKQFLMFSILISMKIRSYKLIYYIIDDPIKATSFSRKKSFTTILFTFYKFIQVIIFLKNNLKKN